MVFHFKLTQLSKCPVKNLTCLFIIIFVCAFLHICMLRDVVKFVDNITSLIYIKKHYDALPRPKYVLMWDNYHLIIKNNGINVFSRLNCSVSNCIFTTNRDLLSDYSRFDAILFNHDHLDKKEGRPIQRSSSQIYIFSTIESAANLPACELYNDEFFNWTFTYRLDSDVVWNYFVVRNVTGDIVAPSKDVQWVAIRNFLSPKIRSILEGRTKAAAWIVSNCNADSLRDEYLTRLQEHLFHYSLTLDVYGKCTKTKCENNDCEEMLRNNYYFYMAFENSFAEDYVTEKVLHGYDNYVVPIVYGAANYSRFLPPGSYINARQYHPYNLAHIIYSAMNDRTIYEAFFNWTNFYTITSDFNVYHPLCDLCEALNSERVTYAPAKKYFRVWWNRLRGMKWCLSPEYWNDTARVNIDVPLASWSLEEERSLSQEKTTKERRSSSSSLTAT